MPPTPEKEGRLRGSDGLSQAAWSSPAAQISVPRRHPIWKETQLRLRVQGSGAGTFNSCARLCKSNCITCSPHLLAAIPKNFKMLSMRLREGKAEGPPQPPQLPPPPPVFLWTLPFVAAMVGGHSGERALPQTVLELVELPVLSGYVSSEAQ